jgi:hypothetical protein
VCVRSPLRIKKGPRERGPGTLPAGDQRLGVPVVSGEVLDGEDVELLESVRSPEVELELELELPRSRLMYSSLSRYPSPFLSASLKPRPRVLSDDASLREMRPSPLVSIERKVPPMLPELDWEDEELWLDGLDELWLDGLWLDELWLEDPWLDGFWLWLEEPCDPD